MKIMTFNTQHCMNHITKKIDFGIMAGTIKKLSPDIVGLNEMRNKGKDKDYENQVEILSELTGLKNCYFAKAIAIDGVNPYGNGLLTKYAVKSAETITIPDPNPKKYDGYYETRCILKAKLENGITVMSVHFGLNPDEAQNAVKTILENIENEKCILMGDFNVTPGDRILDPIRKKMNDTACRFPVPLLSWPSDKPEIKIDYIFVTPDIEIISADIPDIVASDHRPHIAEIEF